MRHKGRSRSESGDGGQEFLVARIDRALASLGKAEINLINLRMSRLPEVAESLAVAAAEVEPLSGALLTASRGIRITALLRAQIQRLEYAAGRVSALHQAAKNFHAGLMLVRQGDMAQYDALGGVCGNPEFQISPHGLEARG
jgi:hypothetical protein